MKILIIILIVSFLNKKACKASEGGAQGKKPMHEIKWESIPAHLQPYLMDLASSVQETLRKQESGEYPANKFVSGVNRMEGISMIANGFTVCLEKNNKDIKFSKIHNYKSCADCYTDARIVVDVGKKDNIIYPYIFALCNKEVPLDLDPRKPDGLKAIWEMFHQDKETDLSSSQLLSDTQQLYFNDNIYRKPSGERIGDQHGSTRHFEGYDEELSFINRIQFPQGNIVEFTVRDLGSTHLSHSNPHSTRESEKLLVQWREDESGELRVRIIKGYHLDRSCSTSSGFRDTFIKHFLQSHKPTTPIEALTLSLVTKKHKPASHHFRSLLDELEASQLDDQLLECITLEMTDKTTRTLPGYFTHIQAILNEWKRHSIGENITELIGAQDSFVIKNVFK